MLGQPEDLSMKAIYRSVAAVICCLAGCSRSDDRLDGEKLYAYDDKGGSVWATTTTVGALGSEHWLGKSQASIRPEETLLVFLSASGTGVLETFCKPLPDSDRTHIYKLLESRLIPETLERRTEIYSK